MVSTLNPQAPVSQAIEYSIPLSRKVLVVDGASFPSFDYRNINRSFLFI
jgi:hypothetical protein